MDPLAKVDFEFLRNRWADQEPDWPHYPIFLKDFWRSVWDVHVEPPISFRHETGWWLGKRFPTLIAEFGAERLKIEVLIKGGFALWARDVETELVNDRGESLARGSWKRGMPVDEMKLTCGGQEFTLKAIATRVFVLQDDVPLMFIRRAWRDTEVEMRWSFVLHSQVDLSRIECAYLALMALERTLWMLYRADLTQVGRE